METFAFYLICAALGFNGWLAFSVAIDEQFDGLFGQGFTNPFAVPLQKLFLFGFSAAAMFCCAFAWFAPGMASFFAWVSVGCSVATMLAPHLLEYGLRGVVRITRVAYLSLLLRFSAAAAVTLLAPVRS